MEAKEKGYVVICKGHPRTGREYVVNSSFSGMKRTSIKSFTSGSGNTWKYWYRNFNFRCVKAESLIITNS